MDYSFDIHNDKGDHVRVALSYYDIETLQAFSDNPIILTLVFYDVTLVRISGDEVVGIKTLMAICNELFRFMKVTENSVLCFYCDDLTEVGRRDMGLTPQEYRSRLFSKMFDVYVKASHITDIVNYIIKIENDGTARFAHFITPEKYLPAVKLLGTTLMEK